MRKILGVILFVLLFVSVAPLDSAAQWRVWDHELHSGRDPFTPPQTKVDWVPSSIPGIPAPRTQCKYMNSRIVLYVQVPDALRGTQKFTEKGVADVKQCGDEAIARGAFTGLVTAIATGGPGAFDAFWATTGASFKQCLSVKLTDFTKDFKLRYDNPTHWDADWGGC